MRAIALLSQKGGTGKTTLTASLAAAAAQAGESVVALDLDPQASLVRWGERRAAIERASRIMVEPLERERLERLPEFLDGLREAGFTLVLFDTAASDAAAIRPVAEVADLCLVPARPSRLDVEAAAATFRAVYLARRKAAFVLNQCPPSSRGARARTAAKGLADLAALAEPLLSTRMDYQDAIAAGLGVTEHGRDGRAAQEMTALWNWTRDQLAGASGAAAQQAAA